MDNNEQRDYADEAATRAELEAEGRSEIGSFALAVEIPLEFEPGGYEAIGAIGETITQRKLGYAISILTDLFDPGPCQFDHHGYCQAHGWLAARECPMSRILKLLGGDPHAL